MLVLELIFLVVTIPFASQLLSTIFPSGWKAFLIFVLTVFLYQENIQILGGLCQTNFIFAKGDISLLSTISYFQESLLTVPVIVYNNADTDKSHILTNTKGKTGIYLWTHKESNKMYIGSAIDLSKRLSNYYSLGYLTRYSNSIICNALYNHGYSKFSLSIMEFIDTSNLNKDEIKKLILEKEQFYLDSFKPEYNILRIAGNLLGYKHSKETIEKMSIAKSGKNNPLYGRTGENSPLFGRTLSEEAKQKLSIVNKNKKYKQETLDKISLALTGSNNFQSKKVFLYSSENPLILYKEFETYTSAAEYIGCHSSHIRRIINKDKLFKNKWILRSNLLNSDS